MINNPITSFAKYIAVGAAALLGMFYLPAPIFSFLSSFLLLLVPTIGSYTEYTLARRVVSAILIVTATFAFSFVLSQSELNIDAIPTLFRAQCDLAWEVIQNIPDMQESPSCRILVNGAEFKLLYALFFEIAFFCNFTWIRLRGLRTRLMRSENLLDLEGSRFEFVIIALLLSILVYAFDKGVAHSFALFSPLLMFIVLLLPILTFVVSMFVMAQGSQFRCTNRSTTRMS